MKIEIKEFIRSCGSSCSSGSSSSCGGSSSGSCSVMGEALNELVKF